MTAPQLIQALTFLADPKKAQVLQRFFKTDKGQYAEGDIFLGISVPETRKIAVAYQKMPLSEIEKALQNKHHEIRLCALLILTEKFKKANKTDRQTIVDFYLQNTQAINNWDLVDASCYKILGTYLLDQPRTILYDLAKSENMWEQRIAIVSTWVFVRNRDFKDALSISELLLPHPHDLIRKAVGWMLREISKRDEDIVLQFIEMHYDHLSRTTLRYAIERFPTEQRQKILKKVF